ncbi:DUF3068 domain-containing protein [Gordonia otitidis]|uniref:DUF3068 domain-containing protein n=1 Tax=Gordonia otitidis (strain DSM 44809 / CCUG 52243 / JCM 12355 / NBRC 100426 / IFM 10032) TaxID=1108044 RepID=H5TTU5_GORO1|nr:DUF3068 domain-containing protein [Gordonia otitidis]GAB36903.1 hypothetical protein GOOTI_242_00170 [Gordonia otitidis NBRC 100426]
MRRVWLALLAFLGVACITAAIAIPAFLVPQLRVVPLDLDITSDATTVPADGSAGERFPAVIFDRCSVSQDKARTLDAHLTQQRRSVIVNPSDRRQATVQSAQTVQIDRFRDADGKETQPPAPRSDGDLKCDDGLLTATIDRVSVNRKTSVPNGTVSSLQLEAAPEGVNVKDVSVQLPDRKGFQYKFGFNVKKRDYLYYDLNTRQDEPAKYVGEKTFNGVKTYEFVSEVPETDLSSLPNAQGEAALGTMLTMPAKWWGISGRGVKADDKITMHRYASATRHVFVEPETGTIVNGREDQHQYFKSPDQSDGTPAPVRDFRLDALKGTFQWSDSTVTAQADRAQHYMNLLKMGGFWLPIILGVVGALLLLAWALIVWRTRKTDKPQDDPDLYDSDPRYLDEHESGSDPDTATTTALAGTAVGAGVAGRNRHAAVEGDDAETTTIDEVPTAAAYDAEHDNAYMWDRPTQRIPRVEGPAASDTPDGDDQPTRQVPAVDDDTASDGSASDGSPRSALDEARAFRRRGTHDDTGE